MCERLDFIEQHKRGAVYGELPGKVAPLLKTGRGSPTGLLICNDTHFPENYRGLLLYRLGRYSPALLCLQQYLAARPQAQDRATIERHATSLRQLMSSLN